MILHLYFARRFLTSLAMVAGVFFLLIFLIDVVEQLRNFPSGTINLGQAATLSLLNTPENLYRILPLIVILATLNLFLALARSSEMVITRASGRSALRSLIAPGVTAFALGVLGLAIWNPIVAATAQRYDLMTERLQSNGTSVLSVTGGALWLRQAHDDTQTVIHAKRSNTDGTRLEHVTFLEFGAAATPARRIEAARAILTPGAWTLTDAKLWDLTDPNPENSARIQASLSLPSNLTTQDIAEGFGRPSDISFWDLPRFITKLEEAGFSATSHRVWFWMETAQPVLLVAMVLIGASFTMRHTRLGNIGRRVLFAVLLGFGLFFLKTFAQVLGDNGQISPLLASWIPPLAGLLLSLGLLLHTEDG
jgi:lipopolysaccharide export system permease protein